MNLFNVNKTASDACVVTIFVIAVLVSFSTIYPAHSFIIPQQGLITHNIDAGKLDTACTTTRRRYQSNKNDNTNYFSTRLQLSYQPPQDQKPSNNVNNTSTTLRSSSEKEKKDPTLYELLGAPPTATRNELKKQYITLAKVSHPDAQIGGTSGTTGDVVDFQKIAEAWRTLGNDKSRRRYDRELRAKAWGEAAQFFTNERLEQVAPVASKIMDVAVPFLRRTSAATYAVKNAIDTGLGSMPSPSSTTTSPTRTSSRTSSTPTSSTTASSTRASATSSTTKIDDGATVKEKKDVSNSTVTNSNDGVEAAFKPVVEPVEKNDHIEIIDDDVVSTGTSYTPEQNNETDTTSTSTTLTDTATGTETDTDAFISAIEAGMQLEWLQER